MGDNLLWQYLIVALIVAAALIRIVWGIRRNTKSKKGSCCGCSLADTCKDFKDISDRRKASSANKMAEKEFHPRDCNR